ncbi:hypothetical protein TL16_g05962 [Triparma laevis f. inornata]|uniref:Uncharacterized protein n=2 Tax=Triparma laevis TaxID=1534972 RepID=A0A9W7FBK6_9STRA|nr:hypothetical protein TL16_g05962 [Triparma laevis f. inornata]GMI09145.1 hypothetical protein TrLO_g12367 [Triparma laevis f. longispina]
MRQAIAQDLIPADLHEVGLGDLKLLFGDSSSVGVLLKLRNYLKFVGGPAPPIYELKPASQFFGKMLMEDPTMLGNNRLAFWYEVSLVMATLHFSTSMTVTVEQPASSCANPDMSEGTCKKLIEADQIIWSTVTLVMVLGTFMIWSCNLIVILLSPGEVDKFVRSNVRYVSWGVLFTLTGLILFIPGICTRVIINSIYSFPAMYTLILTIVIFVFFQCYVFLFIGAAVGVPVLKTIPMMFGGFGVSWGSNVLEDRS